MVHRGIDKDRLERQALELFQRAGISCIVYRGAVRATLRIEDNLTAKHAGMRCYFRSQKWADKVLQELCDSTPHERLGDRIRFSLPASDIGELMLDCAARIGALSMNVDQFEELIQYWSQRLAAAFAQLQATGAIQDLNRKYRSMRLDGNKMPPYDAWLGTQISAGIDVADLGFGGLGHR